MILKCLLYRKFSTILTAVFLIALYLVASSSTPWINRAQPTVQNGALDLTGWNFDANGFVNLDGEWEFYWNQLLTYRDFVESTHEINFCGYQNVPDVWNSYFFGGEQPGGKGFATYRIKVKINDVTETLGLKIKTMSTSYQLMIDGTLVASSGVVGESAAEAAPEYNAQTVSFTPPAEVFEIIIHVSNFTYSKGGIWRSVFLGTDTQMNRLADGISRKEMLIFGMIMIMVFYHFLLYRARGKDKAVVFAALAFLSMALRLLVTGEYYITRFVPDISFSAVIFLEYSSMYWSILFLQLYINALYPKEFSKNVCIANIILLGGLTLFTALAPVYIYTGYVAFIEAYMAAMLIYMAGRLALAFKRKRKNAGITLVILISIIGGLIIEVFNISVFQKPDNALMTATLLAVVLQANVLARWYYSALEKARESTVLMERQNELKDEFLANASYILNTPIGGMNTIIESVVEDEKRKITPHAKARLESAAKMGRNLQQQIDNLLEISKTRSNSLCMEEDLFEIAPLIDGVLTELRPKLEEKDILAICDYHDRAMMITADKYRIAQVVCCILINAIELSRAGDKFFIKTSRGERMLYLCVSNEIKTKPNGSEKAVLEPAENKVHVVCRQNWECHDSKTSKMIAREHGGDLVISKNKSGSFMIILSLPLN